MKILGALAAVVVLLGFWAVGSDNGLVGRREAVGSSWSQVENQYQRRMGLVPNLVETVKGSTKFEKDTLTAVTDARSRLVRRLIYLLTSECSLIIIGPCLPA